MDILEIEQKTIAVVGFCLSIDESKIRTRDTLSKLGADSLDMVEIFMELEENFGIEFMPDYPNKIYFKSISSISKYIMNILIRNQNQINK